MKSRNWFNFGSWDQLIFDIFSQKMTETNNQLSQSCQYFSSNHILSLLHFSCVYKTIAKMFCVYLSSFNLRLWTSHVSMTNFIMWNTLYCSLWTVLNSCSCVLNVGLLTSGRLWAPPVLLSDHWSDITGPGRGVMDLTAMTLSVLVK